MGLYVVARIDKNNKTETKERQYIDGQSETKEHQYIDGQYTTVVSMS